MRSMLYSEIAHHKTPIWPTANLNTYSHLQCYLSRLNSNSATAGYCKLRVHCRSLAGNVVHVLTVTPPGGGWAERIAKQVVVVTAGVQPGENNSSWLMQGFLDFLLGVGRHQAAEGDLCTLLRDSFPCV
uniref:Peptidase M14 domain-containing protein n=1 Tax=Oncorhynchus mykiss TaxID=8022 RepID=A0A8K9XZ58_ONCMY